MSMKFGSVQEHMTPCIVGSSHMWLRLLDRDLAPAEALALQGFSFEIQQVFSTLIFVVLVDVACRLTRDTATQPNIDRRVV